MLEVTADQVLQRGRDEEVFLPQPQFLPGGGRIGGIEHLGDGFGADAIGECAEVVPGVEGVEPQRVDGPGRPQPQRVDVLAAPADHGGVEGDRLDDFGRMPGVPGRAVLLIHRLDGAAEADVVGDLRTLELPRVAVRQPVLGVFLLPAILHRLSEQAVVVADPVAVGGHREGRHAFHEAGCEPAEAAVAERRIGLDGAQHVEIDTEAGQGLAHGRP